MTQRIYYQEPYRRTFDATVVAATAAAGHTEVTLDQTAFYPTSGGQPFDTGTLGGAAVTDVIDHRRAAQRAGVERLATRGGIEGGLVERDLGMSCGRGGGDDRCVKRASIRFLVIDALSH